MLTEAQKSDCRRHLNYSFRNLAPPGVNGVGVFGLSVGYGFFEDSGILETRWNQIPPVDEARLTGRCYGALNLIGQDPAVGNQLSVTITSNDLQSAVTLSATAASGDKKLDLANKILQAGAQNANLITAQIVPTVPYFTSADSPEISFVAPNPFTLAITVTGQIYPVILQQGLHLDPTLNTGSVIYGYLPILNYLEQQIGNASQNQDTARADEWVARADEIERRQKLYFIYQKKLANFLRVPLNPIPPSAGSGN